MQPVYDLHSHSIASVGSLTPTELVARAKSRGVDVLALTDHDVTDGLAEAHAAALEQALQIIAGVPLDLARATSSVGVSEPSEAIECECKS